MLDGLDIGLLLIIGALSIVVIYFSFRNYYKGNIGIEEPEGSDLDEE